MFDPVAAIAAGYDMSETELLALPEIAATIPDDTCAFRGERMDDDERQRSAWRSRWLRQTIDFLTTV